jgi:DNA-directed RNA polymerase specialized sigma24 family protein
VAKNHKHKSFDIHSSSDIEQEVWVIALKQISEFDITKCKHKDTEKALEHWLNTVISNRLANFYRDEFLIKKRDKNKEFVSIMSIDSANLDVDQLFEQNHDNLDFWDCVNNNFTENQMDVLESILSNESVNSYYKIKLKNHLKVIFKDYMNE